jgi:hypothetical protein
MSSGMRTKSKNQESVFFKINKNNASFMLLILKFSIEIRQLSGELSKRRKEK